MAVVVWRNWGHRRSCRGMRLASAGSLQAESLEGSWPHGGPQRAANELGRKWGAGSKAASRCANAGIPRRAAQACMQDTHVGVRVGLLGACVHMHDETAATRIRASRGCRSGSLASVACRAWCAGGRPVTCQTAEARYRFGLGTAQWGLALTASKVRMVMLKTCVSTRRQPGVPDDAGCCLCSTLPATTMLPLRLPLLLLQHQVLCCAAARSGDGAWNMEPGTLNMEPGAGAWSTE